MIACFFVLSYLRCIWFVYHIVFVMCPHQPRITQRVQDKTNRNSIHRYPQQHATDVHSVVLSDSYRGSAASAESWDYRSYRSRLYGSTAIPRHCPGHHRCPECWQ